MSQSLDKSWVQNELIPFLIIAYNVLTGHVPKKSEDWEREIERAEKRINTIRNYDNSIISIDRIRLSLLSSSNLTVEDRIQADKVVKDQELVITMLVRHAVTNGPYKLVSLGMGSNPQVVQMRQWLGQNKQSLPDMITPKAGRIGRANTTASYPLITDRFSPNRMQYPSGWNAAPRSSSYPISATHNTVWNDSNVVPAQYPVVSSGQSGVYKGMYPQQNFTIGGQIPYSFANSMLLSTNKIVSSAVVGNKEGLVSKYAINPAKAQAPSSSVEGELIVDATTFVPGEIIHKMLNAPAFVPGVEEHITFSMMEK